MSASATTGVEDLREPVPDFLSGGGELGALLRAHPWADDLAGTAGLVAAEPQAGRPDHADVPSADLDRLGERAALLLQRSLQIDHRRQAPVGARRGRRARSGSEIWPEIGPMLDTALGGDQGTYVESQLLIMERNGYPEETYYTFSYSPIPNDDGAVGGIILRQQRRHAAGASASGSSRCCATSRRRPATRATGGKPATRAPSRWRRIRAISRSP